MDKMKRTDTGEKDPPEAVRGEYPVGPTVKIPGARLSMMVPGKGQIVQNKGTLPKGPGDATPFAGRAEVVLSKKST